MRKSNGNMMDFSLHHAGMRKKQSEANYIGPTTGVIARYSTALSGLLSRATKGGREITLLPPGRAKHRMWPRPNRVLRFKIENSRLGRIP
jgi:hypothetical protein